VLFEQTLEFPSHGLHRVRVPDVEVATWKDRTPHIRVGLDPLLTGNGKPYVLMRSAGGPLSLHHG
jgi:hypothetical protein